MPHFTRADRGGSTGAGRVSRSASGKWPSCARSLKRVNWPSNCSSTVPVGPWRCLPMMTSALPCTSDMSSCHFSYSGVPTRGSLLAR